VSKPSWKIMSDCVRAMRDAANELESAASYLEGINGDRSARYSRAAYDLMEAVREAEGDSE